MQNMHTLGAPLKQVYEATVGANCTNDSLVLSFTPEVLIHFLISLHDHATFLMTKYTTNSNWALMEAEGMAFIAILFPEFKESLAWREEAFRRFNIEIDKQVYPDGHQRELAMGYHIGCIDWFMKTYELAK